MFHNIIHVYLITLLRDMFVDRFSRDHEQSDESSDASFSWESSSPALDRRARKRATLRHMGARSFYRRRGANLCTTCVIEGGVCGEWGNVHIALYMQEGGGYCMPF